jgi:hypothetical protein
MCHAPQRLFLLNRYAESVPGLEDWHPIGVEGPGTIHRFWGSQCLHWTSENTTPLTRVSLDFRVVVSSCWDEAAPSDIFQQPGYYQRAFRDETSGDWTRDTAALLTPDPRIGYPFIVRSGSGGGTSKK